MIVDQEKWDSWVKDNTDEYGKACMDVARRVMEILDEENPSELDCHALICRADNEMLGEEEGGITGFMAGMVASMVSQCHSRGAEFHEAWNAFFGVEPDKGTVNPALITVGVDEDDSKVEAEEAK